MHRRRLQAAKLTARRVALGLTKVALAKQSGVARSLIKDYESGRAQPSDVTAEKLAAALDTHVEAFTVRTEPEWALDIAALIRARSARGWTRAELARRAGISYAVLKSHEHGAVQPPMSTALRLADALGCDWRDFAVLLDDAGLAS